MSDYIIQTSQEIREVEQVLLPRMMANRPLLRAPYFPTRDVPETVLRWDQWDKYTGLQGVRGINGDPGRVKPIGLRTFMALPGVYGEFELVDERDLTERRKAGTFGQKADIRDLVRMKQDRLMLRRIDRWEKMLWDLVILGVFSNSSPTGAVVHTDSYTIQSYVASVPWATVATATPLANARAVQLLSRGQSTAFDNTATEWMNRATANNLLANTNAADLGGKRTSGLANLLSLSDINMLLAGEGLPQIVVYDEGYIDDAGAFQLFIPNNRSVVFGRRTSGAPLGEFRLTANANNPNAAPGAYTKVIEREDVPPKVEVHDGFNGGPVIYFPGSIVVKTV